MSSGYGEDKIDMFLRSRLVFLVFKKLKRSYFLFFCSTFSKNINKSIT